MTCTTTSPPPSPGCGSGPPRWPAGPALAADAEHLADGIRAAAGQAREIAHDLRPPVLDDAGLAEAIRLRVHGSRADTLDVRVHAPAERLALPAAVDLAALRIVQEAVANVRRHAGARQCTVALAAAGDELLVTVDDDGAGLPERVPPGLGLASIRERATELGGSAGIGPRPGGGTRVRVRLPLRPATSGHPEPAPGAPDRRAPQTQPVPRVPDAPEPAPQPIPRAPA
ncbi:ATP-binding protein [Pseudonocardia sp. NPDC046786]|uniref:sensor histidine kinase n=1 Tax=Pseudonocardia sp. NPDC046786 TaxID=3155471 RepID=UPI0033EB38BB